jgi:hypothetical protein
MKNPRSRKAFFFLFIFYVSNKGGLDRPAPNPRPRPGYPAIYKTNHFYDFITDVR